MGTTSLGRWRITRSGVSRCKRPRINDRASHRHTLAAARRPPPAARSNHAPHHAPQEFIDKYRGVFDDGYDAYREWVL
ncbi:hypothetical protein AB0B28_08995, partial [Glycomyces sp. NPDC046736]|uniref:hypothetical protein n=1 Tax=Glycomyces sp. NPDC046736 TaxID=3155615 RepID=UPI00340EA5C9